MVGVCNINETMDRNEACYSIKTTTVWQNNKPINIFTELVFIKKTFVDSMRYLLV